VYVVNVGKITHCWSLRFIRNDCLRGSPDPIQPRLVIEYNRRPPLLAICASASVDNSGSLAATFGYPCHAPCKYRRAAASRVKAWQGASFQFFYNRDSTFDS
jgi:hypothetical protein